MFRYFPVQSLCIGINLVVCHFRVNTCGFNLSVSKHLTYGFKRNSVGERDFCRVGMPGRVKDQRTVDVADPGNLFQVKIHVGITIHR